MLNIILINYCYRDFQLFMKQYDDDMMMMMFTKRCISNIVTAWDKRQVKIRDGSIGMCVDRKCVYVCVFATGQVVPAMA